MLSGAVNKLVPLHVSAFVMPGLGPGIHVFVRASKKDVDGRYKPGHDEK